MDAKDVKDIVKKADDRDEGDSMKDGHLAKNVKDIKEIKVEDVNIHKMCKKSKVVRTIKKIGTVLGMQFFIAKLGGNQIELTTMSFLALKNSSMTISGVISTLLFLMILVYYTTIALLVFRNTMWVWFQIEMIKEIKGIYEFKGPIAVYIDMEKSPHPTLKYIFEEMKVPDEYWKLLLPVVTYLMSMSISIVVTFLIGSLWQQVTISAMIILGMLAFERMATVRASRSEQFANIFMNTFTFLYLVLKCVNTNPRLSEKTKQYNVGYPMMVVLILLIAIGLIFTVISVGIMAYVMIKQMIAKYQTYKELKKIMKEEKEVLHKVDDSKDSIVNKKGEDKNVSGIDLPTSKQADKGISVKPKMVLPRRLPNGDIGGQNKSSPQTSKVDKSRILNDSVRQKPVNTFKPRSEENSIEASKITSQGRPLNFNRFMLERQGIISSQTGSHADSRHRLESNIRVQTPSK